MRSAASKPALPLFAIVLAVGGTLGATGIIANAPVLTGTVRAANVSTTTCSYAVSPRVFAFNRYGGTATVKVTTSPDCKWSISSDQSWLRTDGPPNRTGSGSVAVSVGGADTQLTGLLSVAGEAVRVDVLPSTRTPSPAVLYLMEVFDRFQHTVDVYTDADAAGNLFPARGRMSSGGPGHDEAVPPMDEVSRGAPCFAGTCITASLRGRGVNWGGWYLMLGVLGAKDRQPAPNWGDSPNAGVNLSGATKLRFRVRGRNGGERIEFFAFGVGRDTTKPFPDSAPKQSFGELQLTTEWVTVEMSLAGLDLSYVLGGFGWSASAVRNANRDVTFYLDDIQFIKEHPDDLHMLLSYETLPYGSDFDTVSRNVAFTYDTAVATIALASAGDMKRARVLAKSLVYASQHDRYFGSGRVRNAYQAGSLVLPPGWLPNGKSETARMPGWYNAARSNWFEDEFHVSSATGNVAWTCMALLYMYKKEPDPTYLMAVQQMADWLLANARDSRGAGGFTGGLEGWELGYAPGCPSGQYVEGQCKRLYKSTEHNIDLFSVFRRLHLIDGSEKWNAASREARALVRDMWDAKERKFWTGTDEQGFDPDKDIIPADIQAWAIQAFGDESRPYWPGLDYAHYGAPDENFVLVIIQAAALRPTARNSASRSSVMR